MADPTRAVIGGWSWGGYITLLALGTHPDVSRPGLRGVPVGDYMASYDDSAPSQGVHVVEGCRRGTHRVFVVSADQDEHRSLHACT